MRQVHCFASSHPRRFRKATSLSGHRCFAVGVKLTKDFYHGYPPRNSQHDHQQASSQSNAKRWGLYLAIALVLLLLLLWLFGDVFTNDAVLEDEPTTQTTSPETGSGATDPASPRPATTPQAGSDTTAPTDPATEGPETQDDVIEIEGDADVEVLDDS